MTHDPNGTDARRVREPHLDEFEAAWNSGSPRIEDFLSRVAEQERAIFLEELLRTELEIRRTRGEQPTADEYVARFPHYEAVIGAVFDQTSAQVGPKSGDAGDAGEAASGTRIQTRLTIGNRYFIEKCLGRGGMGEVYQAHDKWLDRFVALKFLPPERASDPVWIERLKQEVKTASSVSDPHVCQVHDYQEADGHAFIVMALAAGGSLVTQLNLLPSGRFAPEDVNAYARQLCDGLHAVHESKLVHRDLKPANILLDEKGRVKVADFGLADVAEKVRPEEAAHGTWQYMAPEQLDGHLPSVRTDLYSLGVILYELLTGTRPYTANSRSELRNRQSTAAPRPSDLVKGLDPLFDRAILWCLERDPKNRPASARDVKHALPPLTPKKTDEGGGTGTLRPWVAVALFGAIMLGLSLLAAVADQTMAYRQLPDVQTREVLNHRAKKLLESFGSVGKEGTKRVEHSGYEWDVNLLKVAAHERPDGWRPTPDSRAPLVYFWHRSDPFAPTPINRITPADPPMTAEGTACVVLDPEGNLLEYYAVPTRTPPEAVAGARDAQRENCEQHLFKEAGLNRANFERVPARKRPTTFADDVWALDEKGGIARRVEIASCDGSPVYFCVSRERPEGKDRVEGENILWSRDRKFASDASILIVLLSAVAVLPLVFKNWNLGRADMTGAVRVVGLYVVTSLLSYVLITQHTMSFHTERVLLMNMFGVVAFWGGLIFVFYLAVEPYLRRKWPERLSSWTRVLRGKLLDPLVGRDVLVGVLAGTCAVVPLRLAAALQGTFYLPTLAYEPFTPNVPSGLLIGLAGFAILRAAGMFVLLLLFGLFVRREWLAAMAVTLVLGYSARQNLPTMPPDTPLTWLGALAFMGLMACVAIRFGWLALLACSFVASVLNVMPLTFAPHAWYSSTTVATFAALVGLAGFGFFVSLGGQRLLPDE